MSKYTDKTTELILRCLYDLQTHSKISPSDEELLIELINLQISKKL